MAKLKWAIICERAIIEKETNNLSLISLIEEVRLTSEPPQTTAQGKTMLVPHKFVVVQFWMRSDPDKPEIAETRSRLIAPDGKAYGTALQRIDLERFNQIRVATNSPGFPWFGHGDYTIEFQVKLERGKWRTVGREKFRVVGPPSSAAPNSD
jgi:hypothetical protein